MKEEVLKKRISDAMAIERKLEAIQKALFAKPNSKITARLIDRVIWVARDAETNRKNLELDWAYRNEISN